MKTENEKPASRRQFLLGATLGTAGAVAAAVAGKHATESVAVAQTADVKPKGYRMTAHIQQYYETTKI